MLLQATASAAPEPWSTPFYSPVLELRLPGHSAVKFSGLASPIHSPIWAYLGSS